MKTLIVVGVLLSLTLAQAGDKRPTLQSLQSQVDENNKIILEAAQDIMKMSQDIDALKAEIGGHEKALQDVASLADELNEVMPKIINKLNDQDERLDALEHAVHKSAQVEHNLDTYGREAN